MKNVLVFLTALFLMIATAKAELYRTGIIVTVYAPPVYVLPSPPPAVYYSAPIYYGPPVYYYVPSPYCPAPVYVHPYYSPRPYWGGRVHFHR